MNLRDLRTFAAIVELGGFARAAAKVNRSQPALSRQVHALEAELGVRLFDRVGRRAQLTPEGEDLLRRARRVLAEADSLGERARTLKSGEAGILRVGATPPALETLVSPFLTHYLRRHPGVEIELVEEGGARMPERLERGDMQIACMPAGDARFAGRLIAPTHLVAVLRDSHPLGRRPVIEIADLAEEPLLVLREGFGSRAWFDAACEVADIVPRLLLQSVVAQTIIELAGTGYGIAIVPSTARFPESTARVRPLVHRGASIGRWQMVAWHPDRFLARYAEQFVDELVAYAVRAYPGREFTRRAPPLPKPKNPAS
jgi:LysR family transcriptional regulator, cyn operon transcriptional activator